MESKELEAARRTLTVRRKQRHEETIRWAKQMQEKVQTAKLVLSLKHEGEAALQKRIEELELL